MTIQVEVKNLATERPISVALVDFREDGTHAPFTASRQVLAPGGSVSLWIHKGRDLVVRECEPDEEVVA